jgi:hypothetical protein
MVLCFFCPNDGNEAGLPLPDGWMRMQLSGGLNPHFEMDAAVCPQHIERLFPPRFQADGFIGINGTFVRYDDPSSPWKSRDEALAECAPGVR